MLNLTITTFYLNKEIVLPRFSACRSPDSERQCHLMSSTITAFYLNKEIVLSTITTFYQNTRSS